MALSVSVAGPALMAASLGNPVQLLTPSFQLGVTGTVQDSGGNQRPREETQLVSSKPKGGSPSSSQVKLAGSWWTEDEAMCSTCHPKKCAKSDPHMGTDDDLSTCLQRL